MNAEMDISKKSVEINKGIAKFVWKMQKKSGIMKSGLDAMPCFLLDDQLKLSWIIKVVIL